jgi:hypothetical protein
MSSNQLLLANPSRQMKHCCNPRRNGLVLAFHRSRGDVEVYKSDSVIVGCRAVPILPSYALPRRENMSVEFPAPFFVSSGILETSFVVPETSPSKFAGNHRERPVLVVAPNCICCDCSKTVLGVRALVGLYCWPWLLERCRLVIGAQ